MKNIILITLLLSLSLIIGACGNETSTAKEDLSKYPEKVQDGTISLKYYTQISEFLVINEESFMKIMGIFEDLREETKVVYTEKDKDEFNEYKKIFTNLKLKPKTDLDKQLNETVEIMISEQIHSIEEVLEFMETDELSSLARVSEQVSPMPDRILELNLQIGF